MRSRNIKPGFYKNEDLAECSLGARLIFPGLWMMADRSGRLEYRPKRIKAELLPFDDIPVVPLIEELATWGLVKIYEVGGQKLLWIPGFCKHQHCHVNEKLSELPAHPDDASTEPVPDQHQSTPVQVSEQHQSDPSESLLLNPDILNPESGSIPGKPGKPPPPLKIKYLDSVFLSESEYQKLQEALGQKSLDIGIEKLDYSITVKKGKYYDHYKTILSWHKRGFLKENGGNNGTNNRRPDFTGGTGKTFGKAQSDSQPYPIDYELGPG